MTTAVEDQRIRLTNRDFESIRGELEAIITQTRPGLQSDFNDVSLGSMLVDLNAFIGDLISFGQDSITLEVFLATARRYESALRFARSVGFIPRSAAAAEVTVQSVTLPDQVTTLGATVLAGAILTGQNGLPYELLADAIIPSGSNISRLNLFEGVSETDIFEPTSLPDQEIITENGIVADGSQEVFIGDPTVLANKWTSVDSVALEVGATETYEITFTGEGKLRITFGDGTSGKIPDDTVTVLYRTTSGVAGNAPIGSIRGNIQAELIGGAGVVSILYENSDTPATGGADRESIEELRVNIPAFIRSVDKILTLLDYDSNVPRVPGVALAFTDLSLSSFQGNTIIVNVWDEETVDFVSESIGDARRSTAQYTRFRQMPLERVNEIQDFLRARTLQTVQNTIKRPTVAQIDIYLANVTIDARFDRDAVHAGITQAVVDAFEAATGFAIRVSAIYDAIRDVPGVRFFHIDRIVFDHLSSAAATGTVTFTGGAQPTDGETVTISDGGIPVVLEFDDDASVSLGLAVAIGATSLETMANLITAINNNLQITAVLDPSSVDPKASLTQKQQGSQFNIPISETGVAIAVTGMSGGDDDLDDTVDDHRRIQSPTPDPFPPGPYVPGEPFVVGLRASGAITFAGAVQPADGDTVKIDPSLTAGDDLTFEFDSNATVAVGNILVTIGGSAAATRDNLIQAINDSGLPMTAADTTVTDPKLTVTQNVPGTAGNAATMTTTGTTPPSVSANFTGGSDTGVGPSWLDGGQNGPPYLEIEDLEIASGLSVRNFYDETFLYNNEIFYNSGLGLQVGIQAIDLRRLVFELVI